MAWNRIQAARLLSGKEMELFEASLDDQAPRMSDKELGGQIRRVRAQRDKFQDLLRRQRVSTRDRTGTKAGASGTANARTGQKVQVFTEALARLEKQQARRERSSSGGDARPAGRRGSVPADRATAGTTVRSAVRAALRAKSDGASSGRPRASGGSKAPSRQPARPRGGPSAASQSEPQVPNAKRAQDMGQDRALAHVASRGRRQQVRRDKR
jgi:hypothetical protein